MRAHEFISESKLPTSAFVGSDKNKLGPAGHLKGSMKRPARQGDLVGEQGAAEHQLNELDLFDPKKMYFKMGNGRWVVSNSRSIGSLNGPAFDKQFFTSLKWLTPQQSQSLGLDKQLADKAGSPYGSNIYDFTNPRQLSHWNVSQDLIAQIQNWVEQHPPAAKRPAVPQQGVAEYGDTAKGQKMLGKVHHRAANRVTSKQADKDPAYARKAQQTQDRAWDRLATKEEIGYDEVSAKDAIYILRKLDQGVTMYDIMQDFPELSRMMDVIAHEQGLHSDDDFEEIENILRNDLEDIAAQEDDFGDYDPDEDELNEKTDPKMCRSSKRLGSSDHSSCVSQGLRPHQSKGKGHTDGQGNYIKGKKIRGAKYGGPLPDWDSK